MKRNEAIAYLTPFVTKYWILFNADYFLCGITREIRVYYSQINSIAPVRGGVLLILKGGSIVFYNVGKGLTVRFYDTGV